MKKVVIDTLAGDNSAYEIARGGVLAKKSDPQMLHLKAVRNIKEFRRTHKGNLWVAECDMKKFYDTLDHDLIKRRFSQMLHWQKRNGIITVEEWRILKRVIFSYVNCFCFYQEVYRYIIPNESNDKNKARHSFSIILNNPLLLNKNNIESKIKVDTDLSKSLKEKIKNDLSSLLNSILSNKNYEKEKFNDEKILSYVYYDIGKEVLSKALYKKGFRVAFKLNEYNYIYLCKICLNALISLCDSEENIINIEFAVKIISSAFYYSKENSNEYLIDDLRDNLGKNFYFWNKESFWNTWQIMENYFSLTDYSTFIYDLQQKNGRILH